MTRYELLHYRGNKVASAVPGMLLGCDEFGRPYMVIDADYWPETNTTTVHLEYATPEAIKAAA